MLYHGHLCILLDFGNRLFLVLNVLSLVHGISMFRVYIQQLKAIYPEYSDHSMMGTEQMRSCVDSWYVYSWCPTYCIGHQADSRYCSDAFRGSGVSNDEDEGIFFYPYMIVVLWVSIGLVISWFENQLILWAFPKCSYWCLRIWWRGSELRCTTVMNNMIGQYLES
jgi:hypothetical protein